MTYDREERLEDALLRIKAWAHAYPITVFLPVTEADLKIAATVLRASGLSIDALHAAWARHIMHDITEIIDEALRGA